MGKLKIKPIIYRVLIGMITGIILELIYVIVFHEISSLFYFFTGLALW